MAIKQTAEQFIKAPHKKLSPLYVVHGAEPLGIIEACDALRKTAREAGYSEQEIYTFERGFDFSRLTMAVNALSLFASQRILEIRIPTGKPGREGSAALEAFCNHLPEDTISIVILPQIDWQTRNTKWFMALESAGFVIESQPVELAMLPNWLLARMQRNQQSADQDALEFLAEAVEGNLIAGAQEVAKLALLCPPGEISEAQLRECVLNVSRFNPFSLTEAIHQADAKRFNQMLSGLRAEGEAPPLLLWVLANELRTMLRANGATASGRPPHASKMAELGRSVRRHSRTGLEAMLLHAAQIDRMIKGIDSREPWDHLLKLGVHMAGSSTDTHLPKFE